MTETAVKKNDVIEIEIDDLGFDGEGIAHINGYTIFIKYALPHEKVRALVILAKPTFAVAKLTQVLIPSPDRAEPFCPVYYKCGGCGLQHLSYAAQTEFKRMCIKNAFFKNAHMEIDPDKAVESPQIKNYRNKMSLPVRGETPTIGFFAANSHRVVPISECPIQFEENGRLIEEFANFLHENKISGYDEFAHKGKVRHIIARKLGGNVTVTVVLNGKYADEIKSFDNNLRGLYGNNYAFYANYNSAQGNRILGEHSEFLGGNAAFADIDGIEAEIHPQSFFQVNDGVRNLLYKAVAAEADSETVIDAYSGAGVLSAILARKAKRVIAIEIESKAVESAKKLMKRNKVNNVRLICGDCSQKLPEVIGKEHDFTLVLDPPRSGCARSVALAAAEATPKKIIYVSCNPATLARDAAVFAEHGYRLIRITPFDMFPQTPNVETMVVLSRK